MKVISNQIDLTSENAQTVFEENGFEHMDVSVNGIYKKFTGYGHYELSVELMKNDGSYDTITLSRTTTNMSIVDEWGEDETYFENEDSWFDSANDVMKHVLDFVIENNIDEIIEWVENEN